MISKYFIRLSTYAAISLFVLGAAGCKEESALTEKGVKTEEAAKPIEAGKTANQEKSTETVDALKSLPTVTLTGTKVQENPAGSSIRVTISASGAFGSNVVRKSDPERIIVIMHNANVGEAPRNIDVNDGTVNRVEIAQLDTGKAPAVRITIGLNKKTTYEVSPGESALVIDIKK